MLPVTPPMDSLAANPQPLQIASQRCVSAAKEVNQPASQSEDARLHLSLSGDNLLSSGELALETLFPVYQAEDQTLFVQGRVGKRRAQTTLNLGLGQRWLMNQEWLLGYNLFYDTLWQQGHYSRAGVGLEARQEYFGMAINGYYPVSRWRKLEKSSFYSQRPARGMDVILHANLPAYPQLGASIKGEHYWDKNVQLHNQSHGRSALTLGVNYTPISLVSAGYDYKIAKKGFKNQYQVHLSLNYRLGIPLEQQLDSGQVAPFHSLSGRLLAPVQRSNQMVLAYRLEPKLIPVLQALVDTGVIPGVGPGTQLDKDGLINKEFLEFLEKNPPEVVVNFVLKELLAMGHDTGNVAIQALVDSDAWPEDTRLVIVECDVPNRDPHTGEGTALNERVYLSCGRGQKIVKIRYGAGHYEAMKGNRVYSTRGQGDCLYSAILMTAFGKSYRSGHMPVLGHDDPKELQDIQKLRIDTARSFIKNPDYWPFVPAP